MALPRSRNKQLAESARIKAEVELKQPLGDFDGAWPVGSVFIAVVSTNPATLLGFGTWSAIAAGRVLVGRDSGDADFDTVEETGGAKTVASAGSNDNESAHTHSVTSNVTVDAHTGESMSPGSSEVAGDLAHSVTNNAVTSGAGSAHTHAFTGSATSVVQPYFVVYMWKRTA